VVGGLRELAAPFVVPGPSGVAVRDRLKQLTADDEQVLRLVGDHLGSLASRDLKTRCTARLDHDSDAWAERKRVLTGLSSSRWAATDIDGIGVRPPRHSRQPRTKRQASYCTDFRNQNRSKPRSFCHASLRRSF
jgi:hypothetical protein